MRTSLAVALVVIGMLAALACGRSSTDDRAGKTTTTAGVAVAKASCDMRRDLGSCSEYREGTSFGLEQSLCESFKGSFARLGCPASGRVGSCKLTGGEVKRYYASSGAEHGYAEKDARQDCESSLLKGVFVPEPTGR